MKIKSELIYEPDKTWFISDPHFGHDNVLKFEAEYHNFINIEDHDKTIIANWFATVYDDDTVFFLGDASMPRVKLDYVKHIFAQLPGKIVWIMGNHDYHIDDFWKKELSRVANIVEFTNYKEIFIKCKERTNYPHGYDFLRHIVLFHYPIAEFNGSFKDSFHVYGHTHENLYPIKNAYAASACLTGYKPVDYKWIAEKISKHNDGLDRPGKPSIQRFKG